MTDAGMTRPGGTGCDGAGSGGMDSSSADSGGTDPALRRGRVALALSFGVQGVAFALLVTRIPALQDQYGISDGLLPAFLAAVPILAGVGSVLTEKVVTRVRPGTVLRGAQPLVLLALLGAGAGREMWQVAVALGVFGLAVGALDATSTYLSPPRCLRADRNLADVLSQ